MNIIKRLKHNTSDIDLKNPNSNEENNICTDEPSLNPRNDSYDNISIGLFSFKGRMSRLEFSKIYLSLILFGLVIIFYILPTAININKYVIGIVIIYWLASIAILPMEVRRVHDSNLKGSYALIGFIPPVISFCERIIPYQMSSLLAFVSATIGIFYFYLLFRQGNKHANNYGIPNPSKKYGNELINSICLFIFILIIISMILANL